MKSILKPAVLLLSCLMAACSGNPLQNKPTDTTARLLMEASEGAMKYLGFKERSMSDRYRLCMTHRMKQGFDCEALYLTMADILTHQGLKVRPSDLKDKTLFARLAVDLEQRSYFSL